MAGTPLDAPALALVDANVLYSAALRDLLLRAAEADLYRPHWTDAILAELARNLTANRPDLDPARIKRTVSLMNARFPEATVRGYADLQPQMTNHPGDRHVLAAAVRVGAQVIVTFNTRHFPEGALTPYNIEAHTPDQFLTDLWSLDHGAMAAVIRQQGADLRTPRTPQDVLHNLARQGAPRFARTALASGLL